MDIKLKEKIKKYITGVWGIEILVVCVSLVTLTIGYYQSFNNTFAELGAGTFDALLNKDKYIQSMIYYESKDLSKEIYTDTNNLEDISILEYKNQHLSQNNYFYGSLFYILMNKETGEFTTNDVNLYKSVQIKENTVALLEEKINDYLKEFKFSSVRIDNKDIYNYYIESTNEKISKQNIDKYIEIYYRDPSVYSYLIKTESLTARSMILSTIFTMLLLLKIIVNSIFNSSNIHLEIKVLKRLFYVLKYGYKYKNTRNKMIISISGSVGVILVYLYLIAGIRNQNILITFLSKYPFKGTLILVLIPLMCVLYSLKKSLDISIINDGLKKINAGDLEYNLTNIGEREVKELVNNINQIKDGYKIALNEKIRNEKLKTELISNVSHDLKTPLTSIINYVNILNDRNITDEEKKDYLTILDKNSKRLKSLIEDLFEVSKLNSGKMTIEKQEIDIVSLVHQGVGEYSNLYEEKNLEFKVSSNEDEIFVDLDGKLMSRVFENIIVNALKYSLNNTRVYIDINARENSVEVSFKNISNYEMDFNTQDIFERFARADKSRNSSVEGSGMGLAITKSIVELHNGSIKIEVEGDMFKIYLIIPKK
ncbi:two-component sensor kinase [Clostridium sartagoforme AAU1]|uniref:histidine kinase n=1 Tax=Clostridium sartagoforme AAU1 TaxID=1202534 RepID=R9CG34_9CLOT|nr:HAMP domain-containing sensor histidine kinase [Clostridium sp. Cult2]EOR27975.1 two-component sensor kinase [Clostridium sartagoforme AAU1]KLE17280.1 histidine kinase [Clostridium sp. C8]